MKFLVVGLGNPGPEYQDTRHNIGFKVLDALNGASNTDFKPSRHADISELKHKGKTLVLCKPMTFMNLSGKAVRYWLGEEKIPLERLIIVTDDLALPFGAIRLRPKGSDGGHNGLKSINEVIGTEKYPRLRFGIGNDFHPGQQVNYVLSNWSATEQETLDQRIELAKNCILDFAFQGIARTMSDYNRR